MSERRSPVPDPRTAWSIFSVGAVVAAAVLAYYPVLDNGFLEIDDATQLRGAADGIYPSHHFRPLHQAWAVLLLRLFGTSPLPCYAAGLLLHVANALLVLWFTRLLTGRRLPAAVGGVAFALFYAPHEAVLWISAANALLVLLFVLLCAICFLLHLRSGARLPYALSLGFLVLAMCSKEEAVVLAPLLVGIDVAMNGARSLLQRRALLRYLPFALLAAAWLAVAFRPSLWADNPNLGQYAFGSHLLVRLPASFAWLFWPKPVPAHAQADPWVAAAGVLLAALLVVAGLRLRAVRAQLLLGVTVALCGLLPVLPGPYEIVAWRYTYVSSFGAALIAAALAAAADDRGAVPRTVFLLAFAGWAAVQVVAIHAVEQWRFERSAERFRLLMETTRSEVLAPLVAHAADEMAEAIVISPVLWHVKDYECGLLALLGVPPRCVTVESAPWNGNGSDSDSLLARLAPGGDLDPTLHAVYASRGDGRIFRLRSAEDAPLDWWEHKAVERRARGDGRTLALVRVRPAQAANGRSP